MLGKSSVIDLVTKSERDGYFELVLVAEKGEWSTKDAKRALQDKVNAYLSYAKDGQLSEDYPDADPERVRIVIHSVDAIPADVWEFVERLEAASKNEGVLIQVLPLPPASG